MLIGNAHIRLHPSLHRGHPGPLLERLLLPLVVLIRRPLVELLLLLRRREELLPLLLLLLSKHERVVKEILSRWLLLMLTDPSELKRLLLF